MLNLAISISISSSSSSSTIFSFTLCTARACTTRPCRFLLCRVCLSTNREIVQQYVLCLSSCKAAASFLSSHTAFKSSSAALKWDPDRCCVLCFEPQESPLRLTIRHTLNQSQEPHLFLHCFVNLLYAVLLCYAQVSEECKERGELMADVWIAHTTILETVMTRMHQLCLEDRDR